MLVATISWMSCSTLSDSPVLSVVVIQKRMVLQLRDQSGWKAPSATRIEVLVVAHRIGLKVSGTVTDPFLCNIVQALWLFL